MASYRQAVHSLLLSPELQLTMTSNHKMSENVERAQHNVPVNTLVYLKRLFCLTNSPQRKDVRCMIVQFVDEGQVLIILHMFKFSSKFQTNIN